MGPAREGKMAAVEKRPRANFLLSFIEAGVDRFTVKLSVTTHMNTHTHRHSPSTRSVVSLHLEHLHHLRALGVMATVSTATGEKLG